MNHRILLSGGTLHDGLGGPGRPADVLVAGDRVLGIGEPGTFPVSGEVEVLDATGCVVSPGFINILSHAYDSLQRDGRGLSDLHQGVTTEIFGEGISLGPLTAEVAELVMGSPPQDSDLRYWWPRLSEFLADLSSSGVAANVGSFVGAHNLRMLAAGADDRPLTEVEFDHSTAVLAEELADGALGVGSALIYPPGSYATTQELIRFARVVAGHDALYISHIRSEGDRLVAGVREVLTISEESGARSEVYHLKAAGRDNWHQLAEAVDQIESARSRGLSITADLYPYTAGLTGLRAVIPPALHNGGTAALLARLGDRDGRAGIKALIRSDTGEWENLYRATGGGSGIHVLGDLPDGRAYGGMTIAEIARAEGDADELDTVIDLILAEPDLDAAYFFGHEDNIRLVLQQPWVSIASDAESTSPALADPTVGVHPRAYGTFARVLGRYVREEGIISLPEAIRRMTSLPAQTLRLTDRGSIVEGAYADLVVFDPDTVIDHATYADPHRLATGVRHVLVNGQPALRDGVPTGKLPGRALRRG